MTTYKKHFDIEFTDNIVVVLKSLYNYCIRENKNKKYSFVRDKDSKDILVYVPAKYASDILKRLDNEQ